MSKSKFDPAVLDKTLPQAAQDAIILLLRAWVVFEIALTDWLIAVAGMDGDIGILIIGRMDTRGKIDKLTEIYNHLRDNKQADALRLLGRNSEGHSKIRNIVVHSMYMGQRTSADGEYELIYSMHRPVKKNRKAMDAVIIRIADIKAAATFAARAAKNIRAALVARPR